MKLTVLARTGDWDIEMEFEITHADKIASIMEEITRIAPEVKPRPKFQGKPEFKPGLGTVKETRMDKTKTGKDICIAKVIMDETAVELECSYLPPQKTWRAGERVNVVKGQYGPEMKEIDNEDVIPF